jgi:glycosyltransferase involved in cell wall biosynthesis
MRRTLTGVLGVGGLGVRWFRNHGYSANRISPFGWCVPDVIDQDDQALRTDTRLSIIYVGQLVKRKNLDILVRAFASIPDRSKVTLRIIGAGPEEGRLKALSLHLNVHKEVMFSLPLPNDQIRQLFRLSDLLVLPSRYDGWGAVVNEAYLAGCTVLCSNMCGASILADGRDIRTFSPLDERRLSYLLSEAIHIGPLSSESRKARASRAKESIGSAAMANYLARVVEGLSQESQTPLLQVSSQSDLPKWIDPLRTTRVALVYHFLPHYRRGVFKEFERLGFDVTYYADDVRTYAGIPALEPRELPVFRRARLFRLGSIIFQPRVIWAAATGSYDCYVFFADIHFASTWIAAAIAKLRRRRVIFWAHGYLRRPGNIWSGFFRRTFYSICDAFFSYSIRGRDLWIKERLHGRKYYIGLNSLDYRAQLTLREELLHRPSLQKELGHSGSREFVVLCISRLTSAARYDLAIAAVIRVGEMRPNIRFKLKIIGDGPCRRDLQEQAVRVELPVSFQGPIYDEAEISRQIWDSDVVVSPGKVGLTALHALMYGTPVITHGDAEWQMPEFEAIVDKFNGSLCQRDSVNSFAEAIAWWADSETPRAKIRANCFEMVDQYYNPMYQTGVMRDAILGNPSAPFSLR